jgi:hypothetical protein
MRISKWLFGLLIALIVVFLAGGLFGGYVLGYNQRGVECVSLLKQNNLNWQTKLNNDIKILNDSWQTKLTGEIKTLNDSWQAKLTEEVKALNKSWQDKLNSDVKNLNQSWQDFINNEKTLWQDLLNREVSQAYDRGLRDGLNRRLPPPEIKPPGK